MSQKAATPLHPTEVSYRDHTIKLTHRPRTNDWVYEVKHTRTITIKDRASRYETALKNAKEGIDILIGAKVPKG